MSQIGITYDLVVAHGPCTDGAVATCIYLDLLPSAVHEALEKRGGFFKRLKSDDETAPILKDETDPTSIEACVHTANEPNVPKVCFVAPQTHLPDELVCGAKVLLLDLDMGKELDLLIERAALVVHIDHHKSGELFVAAASEKYPRDRYLPIFKTDISESASSLTWKHFHPFEEVPLFVRFVQIGDTWNWKQLGDVFDVKAILTFMYSIHSFSSMNRIFGHLHWNLSVDILIATVKELEKNGKIQEAYFQTMVAKIASQYHEASVICTLDGIHHKYDILLVNCPFSMISDVGNHAGKIAEALQKERNHPPIHFCAVYTYNFKTDTVHVSLRSPGPTIDLSVIAKTIQGQGVKPGGGHPAAAGFTIAGIANFANIFLHP